MPTLFNDRRRFLALFFDAALKLSGLSLDVPQRELMLSSLNEQLDAAKTIRALNLPNSVSPAFSFDPVLPGVTTWDTVKRPLKPSSARAPRGGRDSLLT